MKIKLSIIVLCILFLLISCNSEIVNTIDTGESGSDVKPISTETTDMPDTSCLITDVQSTSTVLPVTDPITATTTAIEDPPVLPDPEYPLGIYVKKSGVYYKTGEYSGDWPLSDSDKKWTKDTWTYPGKVNLICDLVSLNIIPSDLESIEFKGRMGANWIDLCNQCNLDIESYKIGLNFRIITLEGEDFSWNVLTPNDTFKYEEFFEIYLYDDVVHAKDSWYSHITSKDFDEKTIITSAKITLRNKCYLIDDIIVTAFLYKDESDFDETGNYLGVEKVSCVIKSPF